MVWIPSDGEQMPGGGVELSPSEIAALDVRWSSCWTPGEVAQPLAGLPVPWCVAAGWALDLFRGVQTRAHGDIEIAIPAAHFPEVRDPASGLVARLPACRLLTRLPSPLRFSCCYRHSRVLSCSYRLKGQSLRRPALARPLPRGAQHDHERKTPSARAFLS
jgi:hypothetical protein